MSKKFKEARMQPARHRIVYALLKDGLAREGGIHVLQLKTRTPEAERAGRAIRIKIESALNEKDYTEPVNR